MEYRNEELNILEYELALLHDKRTNSQYYFSLLKSKHSLLFSFCNGDDYNSGIIKKDLFFIGFSFYYAVNGLFFDDDTMHEIYKSKGIFDLEYQLPKILYSSIISIILNNILKLLALSNDSIIDFKKNKIKENIALRKRDLQKNIKTKTVFYFIFSLLLILFSWYYISMFGTIYKNTQLHLLKDTLISFGFSMIYPFVIYLFPGIFRIPALSDNKKNRPCLYSFSKVLQYL